MDIHRHATSVIPHTEGTVAVQGDVDVFGIASQGFIHAVVNDFLRKVVRAGGVGVHARAAADRVEPFENVNVGGAVVVCHVFWPVW